MSTNSDDLAYPTNQIVNDCDGNFMATISHPGLTKREYFAAMALHESARLFSSLSIEQSASMAVKYADALIAELNKEPSK